MQTLSRIRHIYLREGVAVRAVVVSVCFVLVIFGGSKDSPRLLRHHVQQEAVSAVHAFSESAQKAGFAFVGGAQCDERDFAMPANAYVHRPWADYGVFDDFGECKM